MAKAAVLATGITLAAGAALPGEQDWSAYTFERYKKDFSKEHTAENSADAEAAFLANLKLINEHNAKPDKTWYATVNEYTDWSFETFKSKRAAGTNRARPAAPYDAKEEARFKAILAMDIPAELDWRNKTGVVTKPKNQESCGSCWAFSTVETMESAFALATNQPAPILSPQQVVSCAPNPQQCGGTGGCNGATQELGFNYTMTAGLTTDGAYRYTSGGGDSGTCDQSKIKPVAQNSGWKMLPENDYNALMSAVANVGPIAISVAAGSYGWQLYGGGVFSEKCGWEQDHAVQLVGYGTDSGKDYWLVRNSWGADWGEKGYIRIQRFGNGKEPCGMDKKPLDGSACKGQTKPVKMCGLCGILSDSSYPTGLKQVGPTPPPAPAPPCVDHKPYCKYVKEQGNCGDLAMDCLTTCGCCVDKNKPDYCPDDQRSVVV